MFGSYWQKLYESIITKNPRNEAIVDLILYDKLLKVIIEAHSEIGPDESQRPIEADEEGYYLVSTLIWYSFQRLFNHIGIKNVEFILNRFHNKLYGDCIKNFGTCAFRQRYQEYYPIIEEDLKRNAADGITSLHGLADAFYYKIVPSKKKSLDRQLLRKRISFLFTYVNTKFEEMKAKNIL